jgi:hypothetical protein
MPNGREGLSMPRHQGLENTIADEKTVIEGGDAGFRSREDVSIDPDVGGKAHGRWDLNQSSAAPSSP